MYEKEDFIDDERHLLVAGNPYNQLGDFAHMLRHHLMGHSPLAGRGLDLEGGRTWMPPVDVTEDDSEFVFRIELPGIDRQAVSVDVKDGVLTVNGERMPRIDNEARIIRREQAYGKFHRCFTLPDGVKTDKVKAVFKDGILTLKVPRSEAAKPRTIRIEG